MPIIPLLARVGRFLLGRAMSAGVSAARRVDNSVTSALNKPRAGEIKKQAQHDPSHSIKTLTDQSFWASLLTILAIPILLLMALFDIIVKAAPWATGN